MASQRPEDLAAVAAEMDQSIVPFQGIVYHDIVTEFEAITESAATAEEAPTDTARQPRMLSWTLSGATQRFVERLFGDEEETHAEDPSLKLPQARNILFDAVKALHRSFDPEQTMGRISIDWVEDETLHVLDIDRDTYYIEQHASVDGKPSEYTEEVRTIELIDDPLHRELISTLPDGGVEDIEPEELLRIAGSAFKYIHTTN